MTHASPPIHIASVALTFLNSKSLSWWYSQRIENIFILNDSSAGLSLEPLLRPPHSLRTGFQPRSNEEAGVQATIIQVAIQEGLPPLSRKHVRMYRGHARAEHYLTTLACRILLIEERYLAIFFLVAKTFLGWLILMHYFTHWDMQGSMEAATLSKDIWEVL